MIDSVTTEAGQIPAFKPKKVGCPVWNSGRGTPRYALLVEPAMIFIIAGMTSPTLRRIAYMKRSPTC